MMSLGDDVVLKLLHTADWHLGLDFKQFDAEARKRLRRARLEVLDEIFGLARRNAVDAILAAGDLFDSEDPGEAWWGPVLEKLSARELPPVYLLPGNHDPLVHGSVWAEHHAFRRGLPRWVFVVDRDDFTAPLGEGATLYARPCRSHASSADPALALPPRTPGDEGIRVGMVHGMTFELPDARTNFPIAPEAARARGLDYLALGDTHSFREVSGAGQPGDPPVVYPGAPEGTKFGEADAGCVALVLIKRSRKVRVEKQRVARWRWRSEAIADPAALERLAAEELRATALRLEVRGTHGPEAYAKMQALLARFRGDEAREPIAGALVLDDRALRLDVRDVEAVLEGLPDELQEAARALKGRADGPGREAVIAERALLQLLRIAREVVR